MVPEVGIEPTRGRPRQILSLVRLPISPLGHLKSYDCINLKEKSPEDGAWGKKIIFSSCLLQPQQPLLAVCRL